MISMQAKIIRSLMRATSGKNSYSASRITKHRVSFERNMAILFPGMRTKLQLTQIADVKVAWIFPPISTARTIIYLHGGGFVLGSLKTHRQHVGRLAEMCKARVLAIDYSLAPERPYPTALNEIQNVWETLVKDGIDPTTVTFIGDSAGGGLALASALRFRDAELPQPACIVLLSPALDATFSGASYASNTTKDPMFNSKKLSFFADSYAQNHDKNIPFISPIYADLTGLPPLLIHVGSEEMLLSDSETIAHNAKRDGVKASLYVGEGMWHGWHFFASYLPEAKEAMKEIAGYVQLHTKMVSQN